MMKWWREKETSSRYHQTGTVLCQWPHETLQHFCWGYIHGRHSPEALSIIMNVSQWCAALAVLQSVHAIMMKKEVALWECKAAWFSLNDHSRTWMNVETFEQFSPVPLVECLYCNTTNWETWLQLSWLKYVTMCAQSQACNPCQYCMDNWPTARKEPELTLGSKYCSRFLWCMASSCN